MKAKLNITAQIKMPLWAYICVNMFSTTSGMLAMHYGLIDASEIPLIWFVCVGMLLMPFIVAILQKKKPQNPKKEPYTAKNPWGENNE